MAAAAVRSRHSNSAVRQGVECLTYRERELWRPSRLCAVLSKLTAARGKNCVDGAHANWRTDWLTDRQTDREGKWELRGYSWITECSWIVEATETQPLLLCIPYRRLSIIRGKVKRRLLHGVEYHFIIRTVLCCECVYVAWASMPFVAILLLWSNRTVRGLIPFTLSGTDRCQNNRKSSASCVCVNRLSCLRWWIVDRFISSE